MRVTKWGMLFFTCTINHVKVMRGGHINSKLTDTSNLSCLICVLDLDWSPTQLLNFTTQTKTREDLRRLRWMSLTPTLWLGNHNGVRFFFRVFFREYAHLVVCIIIEIEVHADTSLHAKLIAIWYNLQCNVIYSLYCS